MDGDLFGVSIKSVWQDCVCPLVEVETEASVGLAVSRLTNGCQIVKQDRFMQRVCVCVLHLFCEGMHVRAS